MSSSPRSSAWDELAVALGARRSEQVVAPPGTGPGYWAGAPSAIHHEGAFWLAYRLRRPVGAGRGYANVVARSDDGVHFETVATLTSDDLGAASLERPALVALPGGGWRIYLSCATTASLHWWVEAVDADKPEDLPAGRRRVVLPGDAGNAWKDPVVHPGTAGWAMWVCRHDISCPATADRMESWHTTSSDGLDWDLGRPVLRGQPGTWDARGARITSVRTGAAEVAAFYDGRATAEQNWEEETGLAAGAVDGMLQARGRPVTSAGSPRVRYLSVVEVPGAGHRLFFEAVRPDGSHDLRTEYVPRPTGPSQSP